MIVVTGASRGLGLAVAQRLLSQGHEVIGLARHIDHLDFEAWPCDVASHEQLKAVAVALKARGTPMRALINAAGIASMNLALTTPPGVARKLVEVNLLGTIYGCQVFAPLLVRARGGSIVNFSTIAVALGLKGESVYAATKAGVEGFSRAFAREMAGFGVRVNCVAPGPIGTDLLRGISDVQIDSIVDRQVIPKRFLPSDVCDVVDVLLDDRSASISGQVLHVGGV